MSLIILYPLFFLIVLRNIKEKKQNLFYTAIICLYLFSACSSVYLYYFYEDYYTHSMSLIAILFHIVALFLLLAPSKGIDNYRYMEFSSSKDSVITAFTYFIIFVIAIHFFASIGSFSISDIIADAHSFRDSTVGQGLYKRASNSFLAYIDIFAQQYELVPLALAFYYIKFKPEKKVLIMILLLLSLSYPIISLRVASRDIIIRFVVICISTYYIMSNNINSYWSSKVKKFMSAASSFCIFMFIIISTSRFGAESGSDHSVIESLLNYFGQNFTNFSDRFIEFPDGILPDNKGSIHFPIIPGSATSSLDLNDIVITNLTLNTFPTVIGTWVEDCGIFWTIILTLIYSALIKVVCNMNRFNVFTLIYVMMTIEFLYSSVFYFTDKVYIYKFFCIGALVVIDLNSRIKTS